MEGYTVRLNKIILRFSHSQHRGCIYLYLAHILKPFLSIAVQIYFESRNYVCFYSFLGSSFQMWTTLQVKPPPPRSLLNPSSFTFILCPLVLESSNLWKRLSIHLTCAPHDLVQLGHTSATYTPKEKVPAQLASAAAVFWIPARQPCQAFINHWTQRQDPVGLRLQGESCRVPRRPEYKRMVLVTTDMTGEEQGWLREGASGHKGGWSRRGTSVYWMIHMSTEGNGWKPAAA